MSLDVYLIIDEPVAVKPSSGIFIRENGATIEVSEDEWNEKYPNREPCRVQNDAMFSDEVYSANITHNLTGMAGKADIYQALWRPEEIGIKIAEQLIEPLSIGLKKLKSNPIHYKQFDSDNGWGTYEQFVPFVENYLKACIEYPKAKVSVSR